MIHLNIGLVPCPNDTYIMAALAQDKVDTPLTFNPLLADVETLNQWALAEKLEVTNRKLHGLGHGQETRYGLLYAGAALGSGCGPLVVARPGTTLADFDRGLVAVWGSYHCTPLASLYLGKSPRFKQMVFSDIMPAVARRWRPISAL